MTDHYAPPQSDVSSANRPTTSGISNTMMDAMRGTKPWVLLIGIVLIISAAFMVLGTVGIFVASSIGMAQKGGNPAALIGLAAMYAVMSIFYIVLAVYLLKYSSAIGRLLQSASVTDMEDALNSQRKFWKFAGFLTAVMIVLVVIGIVAAVVIPIMAR